MRRLRLTVEYDGTAYHGFQRQKGQATVQEALETALTRLTQEDIRIVGAGRTDAGVHALGQVVHFETVTGLAPAVVQRGLNALLPADIAVRDAAVVDEGFHARFSARARRYRYTILNTPVRSPLERRGAAHVAKPLDVVAMQVAAQALVGTHDFSSFGGGMRPGASTERTVYSLTVSREAGVVTVDIAANAYLSGMVRAIAGCLIAVGLGEATADDAERILAGKNRGLAKWLAPPQGLCLVSVEYGDAGPDAERSGRGSGTWEEPVTYRSEG